MSRSFSKASLAWAAEQQGKHLCSVCGNPVKVSPLYFYKSPKYIPSTCSNACSQSRNRKPKITLTCTICGKEWLDYPSKAALRVTCSRECYRQLQRQRYAGEGNPNYRGGIQAIRLMIHNSPLYDQFRAAVLQRDNFTCQSCGKPAAKRRRTGTLDVHHIISVDDLLSLVFDPNNGTSLCPDCHTVEHQKPLS